MTGEPLVAVFVPALMAVGILISGAVVAAEWVSGLLPSRAIRRQQQVAHDALGTVARIAKAADADVSPFDLAVREARARRFYLIAAAVFVGLGLLTVRFGVDMYFDPIGWLAEDEWILVIGYGVGGFLLVVGLISLIPAAVSLQGAPVVRGLIQKTWLGKPAVPPADPLALVGVEEGAEEKEIV
jgi:hypothetical protein